MSSFLINYAFKNSSADNPLFIFDKDGITAYMLVYVDYIVLIGNNTSVIDTFVQALSAKFSLKDLGNLNYFLGVEVIPHNKGLFLSQHKYISDILSRTNMSGAKDSATLYFYTT